MLLNFKDLNKVDLRDREIIHGIYKIKNNINNKVYIGQSKDIIKRWKNHYYASKSYNGKGGKSLLYKAIQKYGEGSFSLKVIESIEIYSKEKLDKLEIYYIKKYKSISVKDGKGYNISPGGSSYPYQRITDEEVDKIVELLRTTELDKREIGNMYGVTRKTIDNINIGLERGKKDEIYPIRNRKFKAVKRGYVKTKEGNKEIVRVDEICSGCRRKKSVKSKLCRTCMVKNKRGDTKHIPVGKEKLFEMLVVNPFTKVGEFYGVSDNTVRKWCKKYKIPHSSKYYKNYAEEKGIKQNRTYILPDTRNLKKEEVLKLRGEYPLGYRFKRGELEKASNKYGVGKSVIKKAVMHKTYKDVEYIPEGWLD